MSEPTGTNPSVIDRARTNAEGMLEMLRSWVGTNSYSADIEGVNRMGELLEKAFSIEGLSSSRHQGDGVGDHFVFTTPAWQPEGGNGLLLVGHHDTVFPPGTFEVWEREGDKLTGPGVLDMKGGIATVWAALSAFAESGDLASIPLALVSVGDEEIGSPHSAALTRELARGAAGALVFEAGRKGDAIITRRKGTGALVVTVSGIAAHAGNHHAEGLNAISALARFITAVERFTHYELGVTVNVGLVQGGSSRNTVPASAWCEIDFRFIRILDGEELVEKAQALASEIGNETGARFEVEGGIRRPSLERTDENGELCARYSECAIAAGLAGPEADLIGGGSDASTVGAVGVPAIDGLGPRGAGFHTHNEYIEISSLAMRAEALARFIAGWP